MVKPEARARAGSMLDVSGNTPKLIRHMLVETEWSRRSNTTLWVGQIDASGSFL